MKKGNYNIKPWALLFVGLLLLVFTSNNVAQEVKWIQVGPLHNWYMDVGSEPEEGRTGNSTGNEQQDGLRWPALYKWQDTQIGKSLWIGTTNFSDPVTNITYAHKVVGVGPRSAAIDATYTTMPVEFKLVGRFEHPIVLVDGLAANDLEYTDQLDEVDENLKSDRVIINKVNTSIGITMTRKISYTTQRYNNNYFIYEYVFKNTGIINKDGTIIQKNLTDVVFGFQYRYGIGHEAWQYANYPSEVNWGRNTVNDARNEFPLSIGPPTRWPEDAPSRILYSWHGIHSGLDFNNIGGPFYETDGHLSAQQFVGVRTLHVDKSANDKTDDLFQPSTTMFTGADDATIQFAAGETDQYNQTLMTSRYQAMTKGHPATGQRHADLVGDGPANQYGSDAGGYVNMQGFGPFNLAPGDSIRIILTEGVAGISRELGYEIGKKWQLGINGIGSGNYELPDGSTTSDPNEYKNSWVFTGVDSLYQTFNRAGDLFEADFDVPQPPPPPNVFEVKSGGDRIKLTWSSNAEAWSNFMGYSVYRAVLKRDSTHWQQIFETRFPNLVHEYNDTSAIRGLDYYYYITSFDDGSTNNIKPGVSLESSMFYTLTNEPAFLRRPAKDNLDNIVVVPNPYDIRSAKLNFGIDASDRIAFFGLPEKCTIRIFTERGDLIETIEHTDGTGDEFWNSITSSRQVVVSGVYIAYIETPSGESTIKKIIIIR